MPAVKAVKAKRVRRTRLSSSEEKQICTTMSVELLAQLVVVVGACK